MPATGDILSAARLMLGTPYHHQGRTPGVGLDCIGLVMAVAARLGVRTTDDTYGHWPVDGRLYRWFEEENAGVFFRVTGPPAPGDILTFCRLNSPTCAWHAAFLTRTDTDPHTVLHVNVAAKLVTETALSGRWLRKPGRVYRFKE